MPIFIALALGGFLLLVGSMLFGHEHDGVVEHDLGGHDVDHGSEPTMSIFSTKVIGAFLMAFGAAGALSSYSGDGWIKASLIGLAPAFIASALMYFILGMLYKQQASSNVSAKDVVGLKGTVSTSIRPPAPGEIRLESSGQTMTYLARSSREIQNGKTVIVKSNIGSELVVEEA